MKLPRYVIRYVFYYFVALFSLIFLYSALFLFITRYIEGVKYGVADALHWVIVSMATRAVPDVVLTTTAGKTLSIIVSMSGIVLMFGLLIPISNTIWKYLAWRFEHPASTTLRNHVVVCYYSKIAEKLIGELESLNIPFLVLDPRAEVVHSLFEKGVPCVVGDPTSSEGLKRANVESAKAVVMCGTDVQNTAVLLELGSGIVVAEGTIKEEHLKMAGADMVVVPKKLVGDHVAHRIIELMKGVPVGEVEFFRGLYITELPVNPECGAVGKTIKEVWTQEGGRLGGRVIAIWKDGKLIPSPAPETVLTSNSVLVVVGTLEQLRTVEDSICTERCKCMGAPHTPRRFIVIGHGEVGKEVVRRLMDAGVEVAVIDSNPHALSGLECPSIVGSATDEEVLKEAGVDQPGHLTVLILLPDDSESALSTLLVRDMNPRAFIITRENTGENIDKIHKAGSSYVVSIPVMCVEVITSEIAKKYNKKYKAEPMAQGLVVEVFEVPKKSLLTEFDLESLSLPRKFGCSLIGIKRGEDVILDIKPNEVLKEGDRIAVVGTEEGISRFREVFML